MENFALPAGGVLFGTILMAALVWLTGGSVRKSDAQTVFEKYQEVMGTVTKDNERLRTEREGILMAHSKELLTIRRSQRKRFRLIYPVLQACSLANETLRDQIQQLLGSLEQEEIEDGE